MIETKGLLATAALAAMKRRTSMNVKILMGLEKFQHIQSWHTNDHRFRAMGWVLPDSRVLRSLEHQIRLEERGYFAAAQEMFSRGIVARPAARYLRMRGLHELGRIIHPMQDRFGNYEFFSSGFWANFGTAMTIIFGDISIGSSGSESVGRTHNRHGVTYHVFDRVIRTRDVTYDALGRFYRQYEGVFRR
jgi:hypothetical protein